VEVVPVRKLDSNLRSWAPVAVAGRDWGGEAPSGVEVPVAVDCSCRSRVVSVGDMPVVDQWAVAAVPGSRRCRCASGTVASQGSCSWGHSKSGRNACSGTSQSSRRFLGELYINLLS